MLSSFSVKYSTRPKNARDRSPQVNRPPHFNFQKQHRPQQDVNIYSPFQKLRQFPFQLCSQHKTSTGEPVTVIAKVQQPPRPSSSSPSRQPATSYVVVDDQQPGSSRQMIYNSPSVTPSQQEESQHNTSGLSSLFAGIPSVLQYQQIDTPQPSSPSQLQPAPSPASAIFHSS